MQSLSNSVGRLYCSISCVIPVKLECNVIECIVFTEVNSMKAGLTMTQNLL